MREELEQYVGKRMYFRARVDKFGVKSAFHALKFGAEHGHRRSIRKRRRRKAVKLNRTVLLKEIRIRDTGELLTDHVWVPRGAWSKKLEQNDVIEFYGRVDRYGKAVGNHLLGQMEKDYRIKSPSRVSVIGSA